MPVDILIACLILSIIIASCVIQIERFTFDLQNHDSRKFVNETGEQINHIASEREEQESVAQYIERGDLVLEVGGRYGTVSALILDILENPKHLVIIEPDSTVVPTLRQNLANVGHPEAQIFEGVISSQHVNITSDGYSSRSIECVLGESECGKIEILGYQELQNRYDITFNTIVADCEGCLPQMINEIQKFDPNLEHIRKILFETDHPDAVDYQSMMLLLGELGFVKVKDGFVQYWTRYTPTISI